MRIKTDPEGENKDAGDNGLRTESPAKFFDVWPDEREKGNHEQHFDPVEPVSGAFSELSLHCRDPGNKKEGGNAKGDRTFFQLG